MNKGRARGRRWRNQPPLDRHHQTRLKRGERVTSKEACTVFSFEEWGAVNGPIKVWFRVYAC